MKKNFKIIFIILLIFTLISLLLNFPKNDNSDSKVTDDEMIILDEKNIIF